MPLYSVRSVWHQRQTYCKIFYFVCHFNERLVDNIRWSYLKASSRVNECYGQCTNKLSSEFVVRSEIIDNLVQYFFYIGMKKICIFFLNIVGISIIKYKYSILKPLTSFNNDKNEAVRSLILISRETLFYLNKKKT